jgi:hypothetical protein
MVDQALTHGERDTLERLHRLSGRYVGGLVPSDAVNACPIQLERLVACDRVRRYRGTGPHSRAQGRVHLYYALVPSPPSR